MRYNRKCKLQFRMASLKGHMEKLPVITDETALANIAGQLAPSSQRIYTSDARAFASWLNEHGYAITRESVILYRGYLAQQYRPTTAKRMWSVVCRILQEQVHIKHLDENPVLGVRGFKAQGNASKHIALSKEQARDLLGVVDISTKKGRRDYAILLLLLKTGLRRFECTALNIGDMRDEQGHHTLFLRETKGDKLDTVKLTPDVWRAIQDSLQGRKEATVESPLFISFRRGDHPQEKRLIPNDVYCMVTSYAKIADIKRLSPHGLRASFITLSLEGGAPLHKVQYAARHSDPRMTEHYQKRKQNLDDNAVDYIKF